MLYSLVNDYDMIVTDGLMEILFLILYDNVIFFTIISVFIYIDIIHSYNNYDVLSFNILHDGNSGFISDTYKFDYKFTNSN